MIREPGSFSVTNGTAKYHRIVNSYSVTLPGAAVQHAPLPGEFNARHKPLKSGPICATVDAVA